MRDLLGEVEAFSNPIPMLESDMRTHDDYALNGQWNYCHVCQTHWSDADGGCDCPGPSEEEECEDPEEAEGKD